MNKRYRFKQKFSNILDIPKDVILDLPKVSIIGDIQIYVENHRGIVEYSSEIVRLSTSLGQLVIKGEGLVLRNINSEEIYVDGSLKEISYKR